MLSDSNHSKNIFARYCTVCNIATLPHFLKKAVLLKQVNILTKQKLHFLLWHSLNFERRNSKKSWGKLLLLFCTDIKDGSFCSFGENYPLELATIIRD